MSSGPLPGGGEFFPGFLGDLLKLLNTGSSLQWDLVVQLASSVAAEGDPSANADPVERIRLEELVRLAERHVADITGMTTTPYGHSIQIVTGGRANWARLSLEAWRPFIEDLAQAMADLSSPDPAGPNPAGPNPAGPNPAGPNPAGPNPGIGSWEATGREGPGAGSGAGSGAGIDPPGGEAGFAAFMGQWQAVVAPAMLAMQVGSVIGHLARRSLGQYDLPLPRFRNEDQIVIAPGNAAAFATDWTLPLDDLRLYLVARDVTAHAVFSRSHVRSRLSGLLVAHARNVRPDPNAIEQRLGDLASGDLGDLTRLLGDPSTFGTLVDTPELRRLRAQIDAFGATFAGYVGWAAGAVAERLVATRGPVREALRRQMAERGADEAATEALFGLRLDQDQADRGEAFIRGVLERGGERELAELWIAEPNLPTPAEVDAPGLWLERVNLPPLDD